MKTASNDQAHQHLALAWARLDRAEQLARRAARAEAQPSLWLLAANSILRARDALEAIDPRAPHTDPVAALLRWRMPRPVVVCRRRAREHPH